MSRNYRYAQFLSQMISKGILGRDINLTDEEIEELSGLVKKASKTPRHESALRNFYGLDCERVIEKKLAEKIGVSTSRVQQLRAMTESVLRSILMGERRFVVQSSVQKEVMESMIKEIKILKDKINELQNRTGSSCLEVSNCIMFETLGSEISPKLGLLFERLGFKKLGDLTQVTKSELLSHKNIGERTVSEIESLLKKYGLCFADCRIEDRIEKSLIFFGKIGELLAYVPVNVLDLSVRVSNCLEGAGIKNLGQLVSKGSEELFEIRNFGKPCLKEVNKKLAFYGLALK